MFSRHSRESGIHVQSSFPRERNPCSVVIPAKAGIHLLPIAFLLSSHPKIDNMDSRFRGNDESLNPLSRE